jgi:Tfp pilus assembly PilM family ATPase
MGLFSKNYIGVDLGTAVIDCAVLEKKGKVIVLKDYFWYQKEKVGSETAEDQVKITRIFDARKMTNNRVTISANDKNFLVVPFSLPKLPPKEKEIAMRAEIEQKLPFPIEECAFDVKRVNEKEAADNHYIAYCTRLSDVTKSHGVASSYNLIPERAMTEMVANLNCALFNGYMENKKISYLLMEIGAMHIGFTLVSEDLPRLTFSLSTKEVDEAAENESGFDPKAFLDTQTHEIGKIISSFEEKSVISPLKQVLVFGKQDVVDIAVKKIPDVCSIPLVKVDPLKSIEIDGKLKSDLDVFNISTVAIGLALTSIDTKAGGGDVKA